jgi:drug/metabolite transporter (DMT)-like permease
MKAREMALAALTSTIWGLAFVAVKFALEDFSAPQLTAIRFLIACLPVFLVPRPRISWASIVLIGMTLWHGPDPRWPRRDRSACGLGWFAEPRPEPAVRTGTPVPCGRKGA